jgi:hypothetical protein
MPNAQKMQAFDLAVFHFRTHEAECRLAVNRENAPFHATNGS